MTTAVYSLDFPADDLIVWAGIVSDIGELISHLGFLAEKGESEALKRGAKALGDVIMHYGNGIEQLVSRSYGAINDHLKTEQKANEAAEKPEQQAMADIFKRMDILSRRLGNLEWWKMQKEEALADGQDQAKAQNRSAQS